MADYTLYMQCKTFGRQFMKQKANTNEDGERYTINENVFDNLPQRFTMADLRSRKGTELTSNALYTIIHRWKQEGWIKKEGKAFVKMQTKNEEDDEDEN
jgi:hypothetical protein